MSEETIMPSYADEQSELHPLDAFRAINKRTHELNDEADVSDAPEAEGAETREQAGSEAPANDAVEAHPAEESADEADAAVADEDQQPSGEDDGENDVEEELPPIDPPRSWTKEEKEAFASLPRDIQESLSERERARRADIDRRLNEAAKKEQAAQAREAAAEQARQSYEDQLPNLMHAINAQMNQQFGEIQTWEDVQQMAAEDPVRYSQWQAMREQQQAVAQHMQATQARQQQEESEKKRRFFIEQTQLFSEAAPEFADPKQAPALQSQMVETLEDVGFSRDEISNAWTTGGSIPVHDHRFQLLVRDAMKYRTAKKTVTKAPRKQTPAPKVQRPGPASTKQEEKSEHIKTLEARLSRTGSRRDALALMRAK